MDLSEALEFAVVAGVVIAVVGYIFARFTQRYIVTNELLQPRILTWLLALGTTLVFYAQDQDSRILALIAVFIGTGVFAGLVWNVSIKNEPIHLSPQDRKNNANADGKG